MCIRDSWYIYAPQGVILNVGGSNYHAFDYMDTQIYNQPWEDVSFMYIISDNHPQPSFQLVNTTSAAQTVYLNGMYGYVIDHQILTYNPYIFKWIGTSYNNYFVIPEAKSYLWFNLYGNTGGATVTINIVFYGYYNGNVTVTYPISTTVYEGVTNFQRILEFVNVTGRAQPTLFNVNWSSSTTVTIGVSVYSEPLNLSGPDQGYNVIYDTGQQTINASSTVTVTLYNVYPYYVNLKRIQLSRDSTNVGIYLYDQFGHQITGLYGTNPSGSVLLSDVTALYPYLQAVTVVVSNSDTVSHYYRVYAEGDYRQVILL